MQLNADHHLRHLVNVYRDGKKEEWVCAADDVEGWVDVMRPDWKRRYLNEKHEPDSEWDGREWRDVPIQRLYGDVRIEMLFTDSAGIEQRCTQWEANHAPPLLPDALDS